MDEKKFNALSKPQQDVVIKIAAEAERQGVKPEFAIAIAEAETNGKFNHYNGEKVTTSPAGARGLMQIMPDTARLYNKNLNANIDPDDEDSNIKGGVFILKDLLTKYKSPRIAVAMYNASPKANAEFIKQYDTNPDDAIMSLRPETHKYSLRVSQNFDLDNDAETGLITPVKEPSRFANYESEAAKLKKEQEAQARSQAEADKNKPPPPPKTLLEKANDFANQIEPAEAALTGAAINLAGPMFAKPVLSSAQEANLSAQDKLELARRNLDNASAHRPADLEDAYRESQDVLERIKNEQELLNSRLKGMPSASAPEPVVSPEQLKIESRKIAGAGAPYNTVQAFANERVPFNLASQAMDMSHSEGHGKGAHDIVDVFNQGKQKAADLGMSDYVLAGEKGPGELYLKQELADPKNAEIQQRIETNQNQQAIFAQQQEQERQRLQTELDRIQQERVEAGRQHNVLAEQRRTTAPLQRAVTTAETNAELARRKLGRAPEPTTPAEKFTASAGRLVGRAGLGALAGAVGVMSYQEAMERFKAGDTSEGVLKALQAGSAGAMLVPPVGRSLSRVRKAGLAGLIGLGGRDIYNRLTKEPTE